MTQDNILVSPTPSACLKPGDSVSPRFRPSDLGDTAALTAPRPPKQKNSAFFPSVLSAVPHSFPIRNQKSANQKLVQRVDLTLFNPF